MHFEAVIFDLDGVLVDSNAIAKRQMRVWAEMHQIPFQRIAEVLHGRTTVETIRLAAPHLDAEHEATVIEALERQHANELVAFMGAGRLLRDEVKITSRFKLTAEVPSSSTSAGVFQRRSACSS